MPRRNSEARAVIALPADSEVTIPPRTSRVRSANLHAALRAATDAVHQRLHHHSGFAAIQDHSIDPPRYIALLRRLHGFHRPFEIAAGLPPVRSARLESDLVALAPRRSAPPPCRQLPILADPDSRLGALYVVEGAALGGRGLARHLDALLGADAVAGRRFFAGNGADTGATWRGYLERLAAVPDDPATRHRITVAATATFAAFETWLHDWDQPQ